MNLYFIVTPIIGCIFSFFSDVGSLKTNSSLPAAAESNAPNSCFYFNIIFRLQHIKYIGEKAYTNCKKHNCAQNQVCGITIKKSINSENFSFKPSCINKKFCNIEKIIIPQMLNFKDSLDFRECCYENLCNIPENLPEIAILLRKNANLFTDDSHDKTCNDFEKNYQEIQLSSSNLNYANVENKDNLLITTNKYASENSGKDAIQSIWYVNFLDDIQNTKKLISFIKNKKGQFIAKNHNLSALNKSNIFYAWDHSLYICNITKNTLGVFINEKVLPNLPSNFFYIILKNNDTNITNIDFSKIPPNNQLLLVDNKNINNNISTAKSAGLSINNLQLSSALTLISLLSMKFF